MSGQDMLYLRELLLHRRKEIFNRVRELESDWDSLAERDIELEEEAQKADLSSLFNLLDELGKEEIEEIDLALSKMASGNYGICESCQKQISLKRLKAFPEARLCSKCMRKYEEKQKKLQPASEVISSAEVPSEYRNLSGEELQMQIFDQLRFDGRIDLDELEIRCRKGAIYLEGVLPSESQHQILLQILTDVMGFTAIIDHLQISELVWEREDRAPGRAGVPVSADEEKISEDVFESQEEATPYIFPDRPPPEKE